MGSTGLAKWFADILHPLADGNAWWMILLIMMVGTHIIRLGMLSNVAAITMLAPILIALAPKLGLHPVAFTMLIADTDTFAYILPTQITAAVPCVHRQNGQSPGSPRSGHLYHGGLCQGRLGVGHYRHRLRHFDYGAVVCLHGHTGVGPGSTLAVQIKFTSKAFTTEYTENTEEKQLRLLLIYSVYSVSFVVHEFIKGFTA